MNPGGAVGATIPPSGGGLHYSQSTVNFSGGGGMANQQLGGGGGLHTSYSSPNLQVWGLVSFFIFILPPSGKYLFMSLPVPPPVLYSLHSKLDKQKFELIS